MDLKRPDELPTVQPIACKRLNSRKRNEGDVTLRSELAALVEKYQHVSRARRLDR